MKHPFVSLTLIFAGGIFAAGFIDVPFPGVFLLAVIAGIVSVITRGKEMVFFIFLVFFIFMLGTAYLKNFQTLSRSHISAYFPYGMRGPCVLKGYVISEPIHKNDRTFFLLRTEEVENHDLKRLCSGDVPVIIKGNRDIFYFEQLMLTGNLCKAFAYGTQAQTGGISARNRRLIMRVEFAQRMKRLGRKGGIAITAFACGIKKEIEGVIFKYMSPAAAAVVDAMVLGEKKNISPLMYNTMMQTGTVHILVVSGFNVGIVTFAVMLLLKVLRIPRKVRMCITIPVVIVYCFMTGVSAPVVRATVMAVFFLAACLLTREPDIYNALAAAALCIMLCDPHQLFGISFQLSFASVVSLAWLYPKIRTVFILEKLKNKFIYFLADSFTVSLSAWLGTMGLIGYYFKMVSPVTVIANIIIVPLASFITLSGVCMVALHYIFPPLAGSVAATCTGAVSVLVAVNSFFVRLPGAYFILTPFIQKG